MATSSKIKNYNISKTISLILPKFGVLMNIAFQTHMGHNNSNIKSQDGGRLPS